MVVFFWFRLYSAALGEEAVLMNRKNKQVASVMENGGIMGIVVIVLMLLLLAYWRMGNGREI